MGKPAPRGRRRSHHPMAAPPHGLPAHEAIALPPSQSPTSRSKSARDAREPALSNTIADHEASNPTLLWENSPLRSDLHTDSLEFLTLLKGGSYLDGLYSIPKDLQPERGGT